MRDRRFGVEIECGHPLGYRHVNELLRARLPQWFDGSWGRLNASVGVDGSGVEARTPPLAGKRGFEELRLAFQILLDDGAYVTDRDGLHVHHDAPEFRDNPALVVAAAKTWARNERHIESFVAPIRHGRGSCPRLPQGRISTAEYQAQSGAGINEVASNWNRGAINFAGLGQWGHGTIELRLHEGTLDFDKAEAWIRFGQRFIDRAASGTTVLACPDPQALLKRLRVAPRIQDKLLSRTAQYALAV